MHPIRQAAETSGQSDNQISYRVEHWHQCSAKLHAELEQLGLKHHQLVIGIISTFGELGCHGDAKAFHCLAATIEQWNHVGARLAK